MKLIYNIEDKPPIKHLLLYGFQQLCSVIVATLLICKICNVPISAGLLAPCIGTLLYQIVTEGKSPMFISNCGATCSAVIAALTINGYVSVMLGGVVIFFVYFILAFIIRVKGPEVINKLLPPAIVGAITIVIGANLATFIPTYATIAGEHSDIGIVIAIITLVVTALCSKFGKGIIKNIPFLIGLLVGYVISLVLTFCGIPVVDLSVFENMTLFSMPDFAFYHINTDVSWSQVLSIIVLFIPVALAGACEHISDHKVLSNVIGTDLTVEPGLDKTLLGDGIASCIGTCIGGLPNTSYGESIATTGFSKVASRRVITAAAIMLGCLSFIGPIQAFMNSIPSCVFCGLSMILYGYILCSGIKTLQKVDLDITKNLIIVSVIITTGVSGLWFLSNSLSGVSFAMILGIILNLIL